MSTLKRILSIFLLTVFLFDLLGYIPMFKFAQYKIQKEIKTLLKKGVPEDKLHIISIPVKNVKDIDWKREGKEFRYKGSMYDVVRRETHKDTIHYHCVNDQQETQLFAHLEEMVDQQMNNDKSPAGRTAKNLLKLFWSFKYVPSQNFDFVLPDSKANPENFIYSFFYSPVFIEIPTPPPNQVV